MITFRLLEETDLIDRVSWINTPSIFNSMSFDQKVTIEGTKAWYERVKSIPFRYDFVLEEDGALLAMGGGNIVHILKQDSRNIHFYQSHTTLQRIWHSYALLRVPLHSYVPKF